MNGMNDNLEFDNPGMGFPPLRNPFLPEGYDSFGDFIDDMRFQGKMPDCEIFRNPYLPEGYDSAKEFIDDMQFQGKIDNLYFVRNPYLPEGYDFFEDYVDDQYFQGNISEETYQFLQEHMPKSHPVPKRHEDLEHPIVGPSKSDWEEFDRHEAAREEAVDKYHECIEHGELEEAEKWADKAVDEQYAKEVIYSVPYVTDIRDRAGL